MRHPLLLLPLAALALGLSACGAAGPASPTPSASTGSSNSVTQPPPVTVPVSVENNEFRPPTVTIKLNETVAFENNDVGGDHNVTTSSGEHFKSGPFPKGSTYKLTPTRAGTIEFFDALHPTMRGTIVVK